MTNDGNVVLPGQVRNVRFKEGMRQRKREREKKRQVFWIQNVLESAS